MKKRLHAIATPDNTPASEPKPLIDAVTARPNELAGHIRDTVARTPQNCDINPSNPVFIYGWNENDEGGWLIRTLGTDGRPDEERFKAFARVLRANSSAEKSGQKPAPSGK